MYEQSEEYMVNMRWTAKVEVCAEILLPPQVHLAMRICVLTDTICADGRATCNAPHAVAPQTPGPYPAHNGT
jgi:hypothetical protein